MNLTVRAKTPTLRKEQAGMNGVLLSFLLGLMCAAVIFLPFVIIDKGFFLYAGDYNAQQIPFYYYLQQFIKNGGGSWSWATDIGSSAINSYAFYNLGSPFMWLTLLFPQRAMPYLMVPLFILKFGCIAAAANLYLRRYARTRNMGVICSLIYAFCGFNTYNIFFNHMLEPVILFPLMLWALDGLMFEDKRGWFAVMVGLALLNSYFFFAGNVVFVVLYFFVKVLLKEYQITMRKFGLLVFEAVLGVGLGMILFMPSLYSLMGNPRTSEFTTGNGLLYYGNTQRYLATGMFTLFPQDPPWLPNLFPDGSVRWTSMSAYLPLLSITGVVAYVKSRKRSSVKWLLGISLICACVPFLNASFFAFQTSISHYARWYYMPILMMVLATLRSLEDADIDLVWASKFTMGLMAATAVFGLVPVKTDTGYKLGVAEYASRFWLTLFTGILGVLIFYILVKFYRHRTRFAPMLLAAVLAFSAVYSIIHVSLGKFAVFQSGEDAGYKAVMYDSTKELDLPEGFYRLDAYELQDNLGLWTDVGTIQSFNSVITNAARDFYTDLGLVRDVRSNPEVNLYALRGLLNVRFTVMPTTSMDSFYNEANHPNVTSGWTLYKVHEDLAVYENNNFIPLGVTYSRYLDSAYIPEISSKDARANLLVRGIGLNSWQIERYGYLFDSAPVITQIADTDSEGITTYRYEYDSATYDAYVADAARLRETAAYEESHDSGGFSVKILMERENLVFFSVPYDEGFTATVNGEAAVVLNVSGGMMAVLAPAGDNEIVFTYETPGFGLGVSLTILSISVLVLYLVGTRYLAMRKAQAAKAGKGTAKANKDKGGKPKNEKAKAPAKKAAPGKK